MLESLGAEATASVLLLPQPWRALYTSFKLDAEVRNGGFHQFFWNSEGNLNDAIAEDLASFGATQFADIFKRAADCATEFRVVETKRRSENTWEEFTDGYKTIPWDSRDRAYYEASPTLFQLVARYVREHPTDFDRNA